MCLNLAQFLIVSVLEDHHTPKIPEQALLQGEAGVQRITASKYTPALVQCNAEWDYYSAVQAKPQCIGKENYSAKRIASRLAFSEPLQS